MTIILVIIIIILVISVITYTFLKNLCVESVEQKGPEVFDSSFLLIVIVIYLMGTYKYPERGGTKAITYTGYGTFFNLF